jgi:hypothetical protein
MLCYTNKRRFIVRLIALVTASSFFLSIFTQDVLALAPELRLKPFSEKHGLEFRQMSKVMGAAGELRDLVFAGNDWPGNVVRLNKAWFPDGDVRIVLDNEARLLSTGTRYRAATFHFPKTGRVMGTVMVKGYERLTKAELAELGVKIPDDNKYFDSADYPALKGVWFVEIGDSALSSGDRHNQNRALSPKLAEQSAKNDSDPISAHSIEKARATSSRSRASSWRSGPSGQGRWKSSSGHTSCSPAGTPR